MDVTPQQLYEEREKRILDAIALKEPDRVPVVPLFAFFNCYYSGITPGKPTETRIKPLAHGVRPSSTSNRMQRTVLISPSMQWIRSSRPLISKP